MSKGTHVPTRRAIMAGLAALPVTGLPADVVATVTPECPAVTAANEYFRRKEIERAAYARSSAIFEALQEVHREIGTVEIQGESVYSVKRLDGMRLGPAQISQAEYEAARAALEPLQKAHNRAATESGYDEADEIAEGTLDETEVAFEALFATTPVSTLGAFAMLRAAVDEMDEARISVRRSLEDRFVEALREALAVLERNSL